MITTRRRIQGFGALVLGAAAITWTTHRLSSEVGRGDHIVGWGLAVLVVSLAAFGLRKSVPFLPLGTAATWLRVHAVVGALAALLFLVHVHWSLPTGIFETTLALAFGLVTVSGGVGLWLSRFFARRLARRGQEVIYEQIPALRRDIREEAERVAVSSVAATQSKMLAEFYAARLAGFFAGPGNRMGHVLGIARTRVKLEQEVRGLERYLDDGGRRVTQRFIDLIGAKDDLDFHEGVQGTLKLWPFVHAPLTGFLLLLIFVHAVIVQAFTGRGL